MRGLAIGLGAAALTLTLITAVILLTDPGRAGAGGPGETAFDGRREDAPFRPDDLRAAMPETVAPVVADDWRVVTSSRWNTAFDVPPDWDIAPEGVLLTWADDTGERENGIAFALNDPAVLPQTGCRERTEEEWAEAADAPGDETLNARALAGTRGGQGATGTENSSLLLATNLLLANYDQHWEGNSEAETEPFSNEHGITGHITTARVTGLPADPDARCPVRDGFTIGISYLGPDHDLVGWGLMADTGYEDELSDETIQQIVGSIRYFDAG
ncbi:hypothetical protein ACFV5N_05770 [Streptomyces sp. NPDC059853]|uniref:hypothetical protein n=1 Tax=Streptomyces sp. NPDC059853 TaxID=3346973 RepID=UPI003666C62A